MVIAERRSAAAQIAYIATGQAVDEEFIARIAAHRQRRGPRFVTFEEPLLLERTLDRALNDHDIALVECIPTWLGNIFFKTAPEEIQARLDLLVDHFRNRAMASSNSQQTNLKAQVTGFLEGPAAPLPDLSWVACEAAKIIIVVTNETGLGIVPADASSRRYRDDLGWINQQIAALAGGVFFSTAGVAQRIK